jgi:serine/threonine-protein kinase
MALGEGAQDEPRAAAAQHEETLPRQFGKYTLLRKLAAGGMAELFLALHRSVAGFEKLIVIKRILPSMNQDRAFIDMLLHEARIAATLSHPNIVQIFDVGQIDGTYFIAMEHIHGEDIRSIVRAMKRKSVAEFPLEHAISIVLGVCAGLGYAHDRRDLDGSLLSIVHRDISPQNIVVTFTGDVKVVDFGIAKSGTQVGEETKGGQLKGKVPYMSPEQATGGADVDWRSDIFSVGVVLFELTTGKRLFKGASEYETLKLICERDYPSPSSVRPGYPPALERVVLKALAKRREDRYQSAREMQGDLEAFVREERVACSQVALTTWMQGLFGDKLAAQKEALQDVKQLADIIAAQASSPGDEGTHVTGSTVLAAAGTAPGQRPAGRNPAGVAAVVLGAALLGGGGFWWTRHAGEVREAEERSREEATKQAVPAPVVEARGSIAFKTKPDGCSIWINGDLQKETTPAKIEGLPRGRELTVRLTKDGLEAYTTTLTLTDAAPDGAVEGELKSGSVTVLLKVEPQPTVWVDGKPWKGDRTKVDGLTAGEEHRIVLAAAGYAPKTVVVTAQPNETKTIQDHLVKGTGDANALVAAAAPSAAPSASPAAAPAATGGTGKVRVGAKGGFCTVSINGTSYGPTPVEATVAAGAARVSCKPDSGATMAQSVHVTAGETARVSFKIGG